MENRDAIILVINNFMAEIQSQQLQQKHGGAQRCKKLPTRIDLTPMVDLGFLLITFFVFTTSLNKPTVMGLVLPSNKPVKRPIELTASKALTLVLVDDKTVGYYNGDNVASMQLVGYDAAGLRKIILQKQQAVKDIYGDPQQMMVLIKPSDASTYKNVVETLDEMAINNVKRFMLLDINASDAYQINIRKPIPALQ
jgi:biopolymer transport protein ExbD